jgi:oligopeptide/dipeptide ABC transporter ATP-binding protein
MSRPVVLEVRGLGVRGPGGRPILEGVDLTLRAGQVTALVGETGCGKTTVLNSVLGLLPPGLHISAGEVRIEEGGGIDLLALTELQRRRFLGLLIGYVPQDVRSGLNPLMTARAGVLEAARRRPGPARDRADAALRRAGLPEDFVRREADRRPGKLSGGQCQHVLIAQAIVNEPHVLLLDEPTASLDPPTRREVQATIRSLTGDRCAVCLVTHDIAFLAGFADTVGVMYQGRVVETGPAGEVLRHPQHPYTRGLLGCVPRLDRRTALLPIPGEPPGPAEVAGCKFHPRCELCEDRCRTKEPDLREIAPDRKVACHVAGPARP